MGEIRQSRMLSGMALMAGAMMLLPCMDAVAKYMSTTGGMSPGQIAFYRFFFQFVTTVPVLWHVAGMAGFRARRPWVNLFRGVLHALASLLFFISVKYMPLADVFAIYFVEPLMLTALSAAFLGEKVAWQLWAAIVIGFAGALVVIQPSWEIFGPTALLPVLCALVYAVYMFLNRAVGEGDAPLTMQVMSGLGGTLFMTAVLVAGEGFGSADLVPSLPSSSFYLLLLVMLGALSGYGHLLVVRAFRLAPLSVLAPFQYFEIISATALGLIFFGDFPDAGKWIGIAVIIASGLYIIWSEQRQRPEDLTL